MHTWLIVYIQKWAWRWIFTAQKSNWSKRLWVPVTYSMFSIKTCHIQISVSDMSLLRSTQCLFELCFWPLSFSLASLGFKSGSKSKAKCRLTAAICTYVWLNDDWFNATVLGHSVISILLTLSSRACLL